MDSHVISTFGNAFGALLTVALVGLIPEPWRQRSMAAMVGLASIAYLGNSAFLWPVEFGLAALMLSLAGWGAFWYPVIGVARVVHGIIDLVHHEAGSPMFATVPLSSYGCAVYDPLMAMWFFAGAPSSSKLWSGLIGGRKSARA